MLRGGVHLRQHAAAAQELLSSVAQHATHSNGANGAAGDHVNLTLRFTGEGREEPIQVGGV